MREKEWEKEIAKKTHTTVNNVTTIGLKYSVVTPHSS